MYKIEEGQLIDSIIVALKDELNAQVFLENKSIVIEFDKENVFGLSLQRQS